MDELAGDAPAEPVVRALMDRAAQEVLADVAREYNWTPPYARDQDAWIFLSLRSEAETLIRSDPPTKR